MVSITCYGGVGQVGGNQILLEDGDTGLFLDFGTPYGQWNKYYEEYLKPRPAYGLLDPLEMKLIPPLRGVFRQDMESALQGWSHFQDFGEKKVSAVLLSHAHLDHSGYISFLRQDIPIHATAVSAFVAKAVQDTGHADFEKEVTYLIPKVHESGLLTASDYKKVAARQRPFVLMDVSRLGLEASHFWQRAPGSRKLQAMPINVSSTAGGLRVKCFPVDHSIPGACAFIIETSAGWVGYTGDLRAHGKRSRLTTTFVEEASRLSLRALVCEGTRVTEAKGRRNFTETQVQERVLDMLQKVEGQLIIADFGPRNVERLAIFSQVAREIGRKLVVLSRDAYLLEALRLLDSQVPEIGEEHGILIYQEPRAKKPDPWERKVLERYKSSLVTPQEVSAHQEEFVLCFSFFDINELPTIRPSPDSIYLYSSHELFDEEQQYDFRRLHEWLKHFELKGVGLPREELDWHIPSEEQGLHASGHASGAELVEMIKQIRPKTLIPVHITPEGYQFYRDKLAGTDIDVLVPEYGKPLELRS